MANALSEARNPAGVDRRGHGSSSLLLAIPPAGRKAPSGDSVRLVARGCVFSPQYRSRWAHHERLAEQHWPAPSVDMGPVKRSSEKVKAGRRLHCPDLAVRAVKYRARLGASYRALLPLSPQ